jgi:hypothetical protein
MLTKKVKTTRDLNEMALTKGATVKGKGGQQFNTEQKQATKPRRLEPNPDAKQIPQPPAPPPGPDPGAKLIAEKIGDIGSSNAKMLQEIKEQISRIQMTAAEPITHWNFDFIRDDKGYLVRLVADAGPQTKTLN